MCEGDRRTPEGAFEVAPARTSSRFGRFMAISCPSAADREVARRFPRAPGSGIGIHGPQSWYAFLGVTHTLLNHSDGCIVLDGESMEALHASVVQPMPI